MISVRPHHQRGSSDLGWLNSRHTFSFAHYVDEDFMGFRSLRVINEDIVEPEAGFASHPHKDMEIISYVIEGELAHKDDMGNSSIIRPGEIQRMTAGSGVVHSEFNNSITDRVHFLQIWIVPKTHDLEPGYEQLNFVDRQKRNEWHLLAEDANNEHTIRIHQDVKIYVANLAAGRQLTYSLSRERYVWIQVIKGEISLNDTPLSMGDGVAVAMQETLALLGRADAEILLFDMA